MFYIQGSDGVEYGPADAATIQSWISGGRAAPQTRARRAESAEWKTLADFEEFARAVQRPALPAIPPSAGPEARATEPIKIDATAYAADLIRRAKPLAIGACVSRGWAFYKTAFWPIFGVTLLTLLLISAVPFGSLIASGLGMAGLYYYYLGKMRGQPRELADIFIGLKRMTGPLIVGNLAIVGIVLGVAIGGVLVSLVASLIPVVGLVIAGLLYTALLIAGIYFMIAWMFVFPLIIDKGMDWKDAMRVSRLVVHSQFWRLFRLQLLCGLLGLAGLLALIIGVYFVIPLTYAAQAHAYEDLFNPPTDRDALAQ